MHTLQTWRYLHEENEQRAAFHLRHTSAVEVVDAPWEAVDEEDESLAVLVVLAAACTRCCCGALERVLASDAACGVLAALIICSNIVMSGCASEGLAVPTGLACQ